MTIFEGMLGEVAPKGTHFGHREHVHLTWLAVRRFGPRTATGLVADGIQYAARRAGAPRKYHATLTRAWVDMVAFHQAEDPELTFDEFAERHSALLDQRLPLRFYTEDTLFSDRARLAWVDPDREAFPWAA